MMPLFSFSALGLRRGKRWGAGWVEGASGDGGWRAARGFFARVTFPGWGGVMAFSDGVARLLWPEALAAAGGLGVGSVGGEPGGERRLSALGDAVGGGEDAGYHLPVLEEEVVAALAPASGQRFLDGTLGGGGHAARLLEAGAEVVGLDRDPEALEWAGRRLQAWGDRLVAVRASFSSYPEILAGLGLEAGLDGMLFDIGVSSHQLNEARRGFSFLRDGPLDMRMDPDAPGSAAELVNTWPEEELARIFYEYGDEKASRRVAKVLVQRRAERLFETTGDLAAVVATVVPKRGPASPATRVFQGLRMAVNDELGELRAALAGAHRWLKPGGRLAVITFHSLEDRLVKQFFRHHSAAELDRPEWPAARPNPECYYRLVTRKGVVASAAETARNPRSRSATLRVVERLG